MEYYSAIKKNEIPSFVTAEMDLENIMLSKKKKKPAEKDWFISLMWNLMISLIPYDLTHMWNLMKK